MGMNYQKKAIEIMDNVSKVIVGKEDVTKLVLTSLIAGGHVLLEDVPGTGKTMLAKTVAKSVDAQFSRIQFTPDLLPSDVTGINYYNQKAGEFVFRRGPVFSNIFFASFFKYPISRSLVGRYIIPAWQNLHPRMHPL